MPSTKMPEHGTGHQHDLTVKIYDATPRRATKNWDLRNSELASGDAPSSDEAVLSYVLSSVGPRRFIAAIQKIRSEDDALRLAGRLASVLPDEDPAAEAIGPVFTTSDLVNWLGVTKQAINNRARRHDLLALKTSDGHVAYPEWQFDDDGNVRPGVGRAVKALSKGGMSPWTQAAWFRGRSSALDGKSAAEWLTEGGDPELVVREARRTANRWSQ